MKFLIVKLSPLPFSSLMDPNNRLRILFSKTLSLHSSLNVGDHVSQPYSTTGNIIVLYILILITLGENCNIEKKFYIGRRDIARSRRRWEKSIGDDEGSRWPHVSALL